jgi:uncharacterized protein with GYD domain
MTRIRHPGKNKRPQLTLSTAGLFFGRGETEVRQRKKAVDPLEVMPKYLTMVSYTPEGVKGLVKEGGTARRAAVEKILQKLGGRLEGFYFAFGENDAYVISEGPDNATAAAISFAVTTGAIRTKTIVLLTPEELDQAVKMRVEVAAQRK